jgi:hypothetical protein
MNWTNWFFLFVSGQELAKKRKAAGGARRWEAVKE